MKFDPTKPHGTITGHECARYEQGGVLYRADGTPVSSVGPAPASAIPGIEADKVIETAAVNNARDFLRTVLGGGQAHAKADVWMAAESNNQSWDAVKKAAAVMGIEIVNKSPGPGKAKQECWILPNVDHSQE